MITYTNIDDAWGIALPEEEEKQITIEEQPVKPQPKESEKIKEPKKKECIIKIKDKEIVNMLNNYSSDYKNKYIESIIKERNNENVYRKEFELMLKIVFIVLIIEIIKILLTS